VQQKQRWRMNRTWARRDRNDAGGRVPDVLYRPDNTNDGTASHDKRRSDHHLTRRAVNRILRVGVMIGF
jgi:hypothetical protein